MWHYAIRHRFFHHDCSGSQHLKTWNPGHNETSGARQHGIDLHMVGQGHYVVNSIEQIIRHVQGSYTDKHNEKCIERAKSCTD